MRLEDLTVVYQVARSLSTILGIEIERLDIQGYNHFDGKITGYCGYMYTNIGKYRIRDDGSFERIEE